MQTIVSPFEDSVSSNTIVTPVFSNNAIVSSGDRKVIGLTNGIVLSESKNIDLNLVSKTHCSSTSFPNKELLSEIYKGKTAIVYIRFLFASKFSESL